MKGFMSIQYALFVLACASLLGSVIYADGGMCTAPPEGSQPEQLCSGEPSAQRAVNEPFMIDISATVQPGLPAWGADDGLANSTRTLLRDMEKGDSSYNTMLHFSVHTGTHIDMPSHFTMEEYKKGNTAERLDLTLLMGPALVMEVPAGSNLTAEVVEKLHIPHGVDRLLLKTDSTTMGLMHRQQFYSSFTAFTADGARYLAEHTDVKTVGIDYLSIATLEDVVDGHRELEKKHIIIIEGLILDGVKEGWYTLTCLPIKLGGAEGAPARCILTNPPDEYQDQLLLI